MVIREQLEELKQHEGRVLELQFHDGFAVRARLIDVDADSAPHELIYNVLEVVAWGPFRAGSIDLRPSHAASAAELSSWKVLS